MGMARSLKASLPGTNLELTGDYNQRLVYQAIRKRGPITRTALTELTGLAKPTIAGIVKRLIKSDLVSEAGRVYGGRGQPSVHLETNPEGCYSIGLHVDEGQLALVVIDALGNPISRMATDLPSAPRSRINPFFRQGFDELTRDIRRDRIIGLGIALSGRVATDEDRHAGPENDGVAIDLLALSEIAQGVPIYIDSDLAAATAGESLFGLGATLQSYYYILMDVRPVGGLVMHQTLYKGAHAGQRRFLFPDAELGWCRDAIAVEHEARLNHRTPPVVDEAWLATACDDLLPLLISINCMLNPGGVLFGGNFPQGWMARLAARCNDLLFERAPQIPSHAGIQPARLAADVALIGAASLPMRARLLPIEEALLKDRDHA
ncbi:ROK family transcriptional regulator [Sphingomonas koreensis]|nr:ROK family transcriptional regulator [Sphingomonas koreensis]